MADAASTLQQEMPIAAAGRWRALTLLSMAELLCLSLWFSGSAVVPALRLDWRLSESQVSGISIAVQLGFVVGTLLSALLNLPDIFRTRYLFAISAVGGALTNALFGLYATGPGSAPSTCRAIRCGSTAGSSGLA